MTAKLLNLIDETAYKIVADTEDCLLARTAQERTKKHLLGFAGLVIAETTPGTTVATTGETPAV